MSRESSKSRLGSLIIFCLVVVGATLFYVGHKNQKDLYHYITQLENKVKEDEQQKSEIKVIEKVVTLQPWADIQKKTHDTVVRILAYTAEVNILQPYQTPRQTGACGTGFFISDDGEIITNHHVIDEAQAICIRIPSLGKAIIDVEVIATSPDRDLALLKVTPEGLAQIKAILGEVPYLKLADSDIVHRSDELLALGYPMGDSQTALKSTTGVVSGREHIMGRYLIQISAPINPGSSGGPALNINGEVVGVACAGIPGAQNIGYIIPSNEVKLILTDLRKGGLLRRPFLGVLYNNGSAELTEYLTNPQPGGCYVVDVYVGSPLAKAGVQAGDMIYEINGHKIDIYGDLNVPWSEDKVSVLDYVSRLEIGQTIFLVIYRHGKRMELEFKFGFSELLPIHKIFPGYDPIEYEIFGGMLVQPLMLNHIPCLINNAPSLAKYMEFEHEKNPALVVTQVFPNSQIQRLDVLREGSIITEVNGTPVGTLEDFRGELKKAHKKGFVSFKTNAGSFFVVSFDKIIRDEEKLASVYQYPISDFMQELIAQKKSAVAAAA